MSLPFTNTLSTFEIDLFVSAENVAVDFPSDKVVNDVNTGAPSSQLMFLRVHLCSLTKLERSRYSVPSGSAAMTPFQPSGTESVSTLSFLLIAWVFSASILL